MKNVTLALLCCSTFLVACDSSKDTSRTMDTAKDSASEAVTEEKELKAPVVESDTSAVTEAKDRSSAVATKTSDVDASDGADDGKQGESIYKSKCAACHGAGVAGAPKLGDKAAWDARIAQGNDVLLQHAIKGFKGDTGYMPPKGGFMNLSDDEISVTVQYMVSQSQ